jgi:hypothetical protein
LTLYEHKKVTLNDLASMLNAHINNTRPLKNRFVEYGFLSEDGGMEKRGGFLKFYKVNHNRIDDFCVKETPLHFLWNRSVSKMSILQGRNADQEKIKSWLQR